MCSIGEDGYLKILELSELSIVKSFKISEFVLSCVS
jgi:hypothetical protein